MHARVQIVELKDTLQHPMLNQKPYKDIYRDIRGAVDLCHRDGSLKAEVAANPGRYIHKVRCCPASFAFCETPLLQPPARRPCVMQLSGYSLSVVA